MTSPATACRPTTTASTSSSATCAPRWRSFKVIWDLRLLNGTALDFFAAGTFDVSYGYYFEGSPYGQEFTDRNAPPVIGELPFSREYGGAHLIQTGYSLPF